MRHEETFKIRIDGGLLSQLRAKAEIEQCSVAYLIRRYLVEGLGKDAGAQERVVPKLSQVPVKRVKDPTPMVDEVAAPVKKPLPQPDVSAPFDGKKFMKTMGKVTH